MLAGTKGGGTWTYEEIKDGLAQAGFEKIRLIQDGGQHAGSGGSIQAVIWAVFNQRRKLMAFEQVILEKKENHVASITLNRPEQLNTFSTQMAIELNQALLDLDADPEVRVILLKGSGKAFCAGIDVSELEGQTPMEYQAWISRMERPLLNISKLKKPVIAQLHGVAAANGMGLVAAADFGHCRG
jgi:1,4-dihydroxy-2-naphthoyl-CoA synthase